MDALPPAELTEGFDELYEPTLEGVPGHLEVIQHLGRLLQSQRAAEGARQLIYLTSAPFRRARLKHGFSGEGLEARTLSLIDYELAHLLSELSAQVNLSQTLIAIAGVPAGLPKRPERSAAEEESPPAPPEADCARAAEGVEVAALVWSPSAALAAGGEPSRSSLHLERPLEGGHLSALSATLLQSLSDGAPPSWPFDSLSDYLLSGAPLPPRAHVASVGGARLTRLGDLFLYEPAARPPGLWRRGALQGGDLSVSHPMALRVLRDALSSARLSEGL